MPAGCVCVSVQGTHACPPYLKEKSCLKQRLDETFRDRATELDSNSPRDFWLSHLPPEMGFLICKMKLDKWGPNEISEVIKPEGCFWVALPEYLQDWASPLWHIWEYSSVLMNKFSLTPSPQLWKDSLLPCSRPCVAQSVLCGTACPLARCPTALDLW